MGGTRRSGPRRVAAIFIVSVATMTALVAAGASAAPSTGDGGSTGSTAPRVIIDTDLSRWWDDASTIGIANVLHDQGTIRLLGVVSDVANPVAVAAIDAINTAYDHANIPVGDVPGSDTGTFDSGYTDELVARLPSSITHSRETPDAADVYRRLLAKSRDHSVVIVSIGGYTNLANLLASDRGQGSKLDGRALVAKKV